MDLATLRRRYQSLWIGEAVAIAVFLAIFLYWFRRNPEWSAWTIRASALAVVIFVLLQGISWWRLKIKTLDAGEREIPARALRRYRTLRWVNWVLTALLLVVVWLKWQFSPGSLASNDLWIGLLIILLALLEQINYYYIQLMYDNPYDWGYLRKHRRLRMGTIGKALANVR